MPEWDRRDLLIRSRRSMLHAAELAQEAPGAPRDTIVARARALRRKVEIALDVDNVQTFAPLTVEVLVAEQAFRDCVPEAELADA